MRLARSHGAPCFHIQTEADILPERFESVEVVGLTAGASTPDATIEAVHDALVAVETGLETPAHALIQA